MLLETVTTTSQNVIHDLKAQKINLKDKEVIYFFKKNCSLDRSQIVILNDTYLLAHEKHIQPNE